MPLHVFTRKSDSIFLLLSSFRASHYFYFSPFMSVAVRNARLSLMDSDPGNTTWFRFRSRYNESHRRKEIPDPIEQEAELKAIYAGRK